jgi:hypothetical protein
MTMTDRSEETGRTGLWGRTILVLEDEPLIALDVEMTLERAGVRVLGPVRDEPGAMRAIDAALPDGASPNSAANGPLHGAVLDVHLGSHTCEAVAARLVALGVPFVFYTGNLHGGDAFVERMGAPVVRKPNVGSDLLDALIGELHRHGTGSPVRR